MSLNDFPDGSIVLFSGKGILSSAIKIGTFSQFSHVGVLVRDPRVSPNVMIWESTTLSNLKDLKSGVNIEGVQLVDFFERVQTYDGGISIRKLENVEFHGYEKEKVYELIDKLNGRPYESKWMELISSALPSFLSNQKENLKSVFCSELVAEYLQVRGVLDENIPSNSYTPDSFSEKSNLRLKKGSLAPEKIIKPFE